MKNHKAFTIAEVLIALGIIGVVAMAVLPALQGNIDERKWTAQKQALYSRIAQAVSTMPGLNGFGVSIDNPNETKNMAAVTFLNEFKNYYKINNICEYNNIPDCDIRFSNGSLNNITNIPGTMINISVKSINEYLTANDVELADNNANGIKPAAFEAMSGEKILVFYNPYCMVNPIKENPDDSQYMYNKVCVNFIYDLNGTKMPNAVGKDIGIITALYAVDSVVVAPMAVNGNIGNQKYAEAMLACPNRDESTRLPNLEEAIALKYNYKLFSEDTSSSEFWTNSFAPNNKAWAYDNEGSYYAADKTDNKTAWCVKQ